MRLLNRIRCWLRGRHDDHRVCQPEKRNVRLRCADCGRETSGWTIYTNQPAVTAHGYPERHRMPSKATAIRKPQQWVHAVYSRKEA